MYVKSRCAPLPKSEGKNRDELSLHMAVKIYGSNSKVFTSYRKGPYLVSLHQAGMFSED